MSFDRTPSSRAPQGSSRTNEVKGVNRDIEAPQPVRPRLCLEHGPAQGFNQALFRRAKLRFPNSIFAIASRCTSSGPSTIRTVR